MVWTLDISSTFSQFEPFSIQMHPLISHSSLLDWNQYEKGNNHAQTLIIVPLVGAFVRIDRAHVRPITVWYEAWRKCDGNNAWAVRRSEVIIYLLSFSQKITPSCMWCLKTGRTNVFDDAKGNCQSCRNSRPARWLRCITKPFSVIN